MDDSVGTRGKGYHAHRSSETGRYVSSEFARRNPNTTEREWIEVAQDADPDEAALVNALRYGKLEVEPENVAEFFMDAHGILYRAYREKMRDMER